MEKFSSTNTVKLNSQVTLTPTSKFFLQLGDTEFRLPISDVITKYSGLMTRCKQEGDNIICVIPTNSHETLALLLISIQRFNVAENMSFFHYLDSNIPNEFVNTFGDKKIELFVPSTTDINLLNDYFVSAVELPIEISNHIPYCFLDKKYIPYALGYVDGNIKPRILRYAIQYIHAYEVYYSATMKLEPILYTNQFEALQKLPTDKYKDCWTNYIRTEIIVKQPGTKVITNRSYSDTECIIKGRLKASKHWNAIKTILEQGWGVVTGGFIAGCIFGTTYDDIDICIDFGVDPKLIRSLFDGHEIINKRDDRFKVDNIDIFFSATNYIHNISCFHFSVARAFYNGHLYMLPSCLLSIMNGGIIHVTSRKVKPSAVRKYLSRGYMFERTDVSNILGNARDLKVKVGIKHSDKDQSGSFKLTYRFGDITVNTPSQPENIILSDEEEIVLPKQQSSDDSDQDMEVKSDGSYDYY